MDPYLTLPYSAKVVSLEIQQELGGEYPESASYIKEEKKLVHPNDPTMISAAKLISSIN